MKGKESIKENWITCEIPTQINKQSDLHGDASHLGFEWETLRALEERWEAVLFGGNWPSQAS